MGTWEIIKELMQKYPERVWTAPEIASILYPGVHEYEWGIKRSKIATCLKKAERYGMVRRCGCIRSKRNTLATAWVLA